MRFQKWSGIAVCAAVLGGALVWNGAQSQAQNAAEMRNLLGIKEPRIKLSREEAARGFVALMQRFDFQSRPAMEFEKGEPDAAMWSSFSLKSERLGVGMGALLLKMAAQWKQPNQRVRVQSEGNKTATVIVETDATMAARPLVLIEENGSWGVDLVETYAQWNGLEGAAKTAALQSLVVEFNRERENARRRSCQSNLKQIGLGLAQYVQDYDEKMPPARQWIDVLQPYVISEQIFVCPSVPSGKGYGYAFNSKLSRKHIAYLESSALTVSIYETQVLKRNAFGLGENQAFRHEGGANYTFADGHVKWLPSSTKPSFNFKP